MAAAVVGDDVYGEDPTVNELQERAAHLMAKEDALFVSSGTMGNLLGILINARPGREVIVDSESHMFLYEGGGPSALGGVQLRPVPTSRGIMSPEQIDSSIRPNDEVDEPRTAMWSFENTHNCHGGICWRPESIDAAVSAARGNRLRIHLDGARIWNAAVAMRVAPAEIARGADTVTFCLSKGLGCPVGSLFCGTQSAVDEARRWRKMLGGGWRQAGVMAAAGLWALDNMVDRLDEDHRNARTLAEGLAELDGIEIDISRVETNIVIFNLKRMSSQEFLSKCRNLGVMGGGYVAGRVRFVTHFGVSASDIQHVLFACSKALAA